MDDGIPERERERDAESDAVVVTMDGGEKSIPSVVIIHSDCVRSG